MIKWAALCRPKKYGGMGFTDCRVMNICLLCKWIYRIESDDISPCCELLRKNIFKGGVSVEVERAKFQSIARVFIK